MDCTQIITSLFLLAPCSDGGGTSMDLVIAESLASPERIEQDRVRDPLRRPDLILSFFEIEPGMTVLDLFSGGGYYTEIVSQIVGEGGKVVAHNNDAYLAYAKDALASRFTDDRLPNVERITSEADALSLPANTFDATLAMLTWHDFYYMDEKNGWPSIDTSKLITKLCSALKPGAILGLSDHVAVAGSDPRVTGQEFHRIDPAQIKADLNGSCFEFKGEISALRNPDDDHSQSMYSEGIRGKTDRVVYKFQRK